MCFQSVGFGVQAHTDGLDDHIVIPELGDGAVGDETLLALLDDDNCFLRRHFEMMCSYGQALV